MSVGKTLLKVGLAAGAAYGAYYLYKNYLKQPTVKRDFDDAGVDAGDFAYDEDARTEESFAEKIKAAAEKKLNQIK